MFRPEAPENLTPEASRRSHTREFAAVLVAVLLAAGGVIAQVASAPQAPSAAATPQVIISTAAPAAPVSTTAVASASAAPAATATPFVMPAGPWKRLGEWKDDEEITTADFTLRGPWRVRWRLTPGPEVFTLMVSNAANALDTRFIYADPGATEGIIVEPKGGAYSLMFHNSRPYEVILEDLDAPLP